MSIFHTYFASIAVISHFFENETRLCFRSDGMEVPMEKSAMVFDWEVKERDAGMYSCQASFYHHAATVSFLVEVTSEEELLGER